MVKIVVSAILFSFVLTGCPSGHSKVNGVSIKQDDSFEATMFRQNCAICHGPEGFGKMVNGVVVPSLRSGDAAKRSEEEIYNQIANGKLPMPSFTGQLTESEMRRMAKFIKEEVQGRKSGTPK